MEHLGNLDARTKNFVAARAMYGRSMKTRKELYGEEHGGYLQVTFATGVCYAMSGDPKSAEAVMRGPMRTVRNTFGPDSLQYADAMYKFSLALIGQKKLTEAEALCWQAISIATKHQDEERSAHIIAMSLYNISEVQVACDDKQGAERSLLSSSQIFEMNDLTRYPQYVDVLSRHASVLRKLGRHNDAKQVEEKMAAIQSLSSRK